VGEVVISVIDPSLAAKKASKEVSALKEYDYS